MTDDIELARLATEYIAAVRADDTMAMARLVEETRARRRVLSPPDETETNSSAYRVDLYEDANGALLLVGPGPSGFAYFVGDDDSAFESVAVAILNGDARDWRPPPPIPAAWLNLTFPAWRLIARYDELAGEVIVERDPASGQLMAGANGRRYLGVDLAQAVERRR